MASPLAMLRGFYAVLDRPDPALLDRLMHGCGARVVQLRLKPATPTERRAAAVWARAATQAAGVALIINDDLELALACDADGVHLGQGDLPLSEARTRVAAAGGTLWLGYSTHSAAQVREACQAGATYLGFGPVFATSTKLNPDPVVGLAGLAEACRLAGEVPVVAIGGLTPANVADVYAAGARAACAIASVNGAADVAAAGRAMHGPVR